ncbi:MAG: HypC/HybG/HupF family hydrogenase formation chaperone [Planctomycetes bacterium]|nr:HypC/HybG/HupF family hydrogenase formation chaperone [Planctomycetota bacterium]
MCLAIPMQLTSRTEQEGTCELHGVRRTVSLALCPEAEVGDHVLVHAGYAIGRLDREEAEATLALLDEVLRQELPPGEPGTGPGGSGAGPAGGSAGGGAP